MASSKLLGLVLIGAVIQFHSVRAANPIASGLFTLEGCDAVDVDDLLVNAVNMADAAISAINIIIDQPVPYKKDGDSSWESLRSAIMFWGINFGPENEGHVEIDDEGKQILNFVKDRYQGVVAALAPGGTVHPSDCFIFCRPQQDPYPFEVPEKVGDLYNIFDAATAQTPLSQIPGPLPKVVFAPVGGFNTNSPDPNRIGYRRIVYAFGDKETPHPDICAHVSSTRPADAFVLKPVYYDADLRWMALCDSFYNRPATVGRNVDPNAHDLDAFFSQDSGFLHELMHLVWPDIIDVLETVGNDKVARRFYGNQPCQVLAMDDSLGPEKAKFNADNYRMFAIASYLQTHHWPIAI